MCMSSSSGAELDTANQERAAQIARWLEEDWAKRFQPWEQGLAGDIINQNEKIAEDVKQAQLDTQKSYEASKATAERNLSRYGNQQDASQAAMQSKAQQLGSQGAQIGAMESARSGSINRYDNLMQSMVNVGRGVQSQGLGGIQTGMSLEQQRNQVAIQQQANQSSGLMGGLGTLVGLGSAALIQSDKNTKTNIRKASTRQALRDVDSVELKRWDYKPGFGLGRELKGHIGGMAQDMPNSMVNKEKTMVDLGDSVMSLVGATQELNKRIRKLEKRHGR